MKRFRHLTTSVMARVDSVVRGIENHDAVVAASLEDLRRSLAQARVRQARVRAERERQGQRVESLREEAKTWRERARVKADDEATALECLRRSRHCLRRADELATARDNQLQVERRLGGELERLSRRYEDLKAKRHSLRGRQAAAEAARAADAVDAADDTVLEDTLERWDIDITESELSAGEVAGEDSLSQRLDEEETLASLRAELEAIKQGKEDRGDAQ